MATTEERLAFLEGRVEEHSRGMDGIRDAIVHFERRVDARFASVEDRLTALDRKVDALGQELKGEIGRLSTEQGRLSAELSQKLTEHFRWTVGILLTAIGMLFASSAAIVAAFITR